jgi:hypothetical protein
MNKNGYAPVSLTKLGTRDRFLKKDSFGVCYFHKILLESWTIKQFTGVYKQAFCLPNFCHKKLPKSFTNGAVSTQGVDFLLIGSSAQFLMANFFLLFRAK